MKRASLAIFLFIVLGVCYGILRDNRTFYQLLKPLIMASLGMYYLASTQRSSTSYMILSAILFCLIGDVLLLFPNLFIQGLIAFLAAHIFYIIAYRKFKSAVVISDLSGVHTARLAFPVLLAGTGLVIILYPNLGDLKVPVIIYSLVICLMVINAFLRYGRTSTKSFWLVSIGAFLFMISDSILAIHRFYAVIAYADLMIMLTYMVGQFLIVQGLISHPNRKSETV